MRSLLSMIAVCLICLSSAATVRAEKLALGPASIYLDMSLVPEPFVDVGEPYSDFHATSVGRVNCIV